MGRPGKSAENADGWSAVPPHRVGRRRHDRNEPIPSPIYQ